jgi:Spy/CpxP family protein refolding chaperone
MPYNLGGWAAVTLASWSLLACTREPKPDNAAAPAPGASASVARFAGTAPKPRPSAGHVRGPAGALLSELRDLELSPQQMTAVSAIEADLRALSDPWRMQGELAQAVAAEVRAGKVDRAKLEPQLKIARDAATDGKARQAKALNALHATLDESQRKTLVGAVRQRQEQRGRHTAFAGRGEQTLKGLGERRAKRELERLSTDLELDPEQRAKAEKLVAATPSLGTSFRETREAPAALLDAFEKPTFDATKLELDQDGEQALNQRIDYLNELTQILRPEQRTKLASSLGDRGGLDQYRKLP